EFKSDFNFIFSFEKSLFKHESFLVSTKTALTITRVS
ncbi:hypothetical protein D030_3545B, partial [Vibrio parahaemolyticus AQ3810]